MEDVAGEPPAVGRALLRDVVKIGLPWQLGHMVALGAAAGGFERDDPLTVGAAVVVYAWLVVMVLTTALGSGRALHDRLVGTRVESSDAGALTSRRADPPR